MVDRSHDRKITAVVCNVTNIEENEKYEETVVLVSNWID